MRLAHPVPQLGQARGGALADLVHALVGGQHVVRQHAPGDDHLGQCQHHQQGRTHLDGALGGPVDGVVGVVGQVRPDDDPASCLQLLGHWLLLETTSGPAARWQPAYRR